MFILSVFRTECVIISYSVFFFFARSKRIACVPIDSNFFSSLALFPTSLDTLVQICIVLSYCYADIQYTRHQTDDHIHNKYFFLLILRNLFEKLRALSCSATFIIHQLEKFKFEFK